MSVLLTSEVYRRNRVEHIFTADPLPNIRIGVVLKRVTNVLQEGPGKRNTRNALAPLSAINPEKDSFWTGLVGWQEKVFSPGYGFYK
jgi:hypothetical protein